MDRKTILVPASINIYQAAVSAVSQFLRARSMVWLLTRVNGTDIDHWLAPAYIRTRFQALTPFASICCVFVLQFIYSKNPIPQVVQRT